MEYTLEKIKQFCGNEATIYSVYLHDEDLTLFERFLAENKNSFKSEIKNIIARLKTIGHKTGAREQFFKLNEGKAGDDVCALYDIPGSKLRLYCIRISSFIVILGGGGPKPKNIRALQENQKLKDENYLLRLISEQLDERIHNKEIEFLNNGFELTGDLEFIDDEED